VKFLEHGVRPDVKVWSENRGANVRILVQDNGIGIDPDQHEKIFAIFQRVSRDYDGTGIGLAIVKKAVHRMGGQVGLISALGQGSTFWIELKRARDEKA
jgi:signal transduction histidine kinase